MGSVDQSVTLWRGMGVLALVRALMVTALALTAWTSGSEFLRQNPALWVVTSYWVCSMLLLGLNTSSRLNIFFRELLAAAMVVDVLHITAVLFFFDLARSGFASLYFVPVVGAALLAPPFPALGTAAAATLGLLFVTFGRAPYVRDDTLLLQAALLGAGFFAVALVLGRIGRRVLEQEAIVLEQKRRLENQVQLNKVVVRELDRGLLALSMNGEVRLLNAQAARLLGLVEHSDGAVQVELWKDYPELMATLIDWRDQPGADLSTMYFDFLLVKHAQEVTPPRHVRAQPIVAPQISAGLADLLVALEDLRELEGRAMQLKLASMGRLTASIAHEIRNPLAAISYASSLMLEEFEASPPRLLRIVHENVKRINRIVEDVLSVSRSGRVRGEAIQLLDVVSQVVSELQRDPNMSPGRISVQIPNDLIGWFDRAHLVQILDNLLQNASRYATSRSGAIHVVGVAKEGADDKQTEPYIDLTVRDDGPGLTHDVEAHLFEPFFTTYAQGTGLGLYLARELAMANDASLFVAANQTGADGPTGVSFTLRFRRLLKTHEVT